MSSSTISEKFQQFLSHGDTGYKQHQYDGLEWCIAKENKESAEHDVRGGFIADEKEPEEAPVEEPEEEEEESDDPSEIP